MTFSRWKDHVESASSGVQERHPSLTIRMQKHSLKGETGDAPFKRAPGPPIRADHLDAFRDLWNLCSIRAQKVHSTVTTVFAESRRISVCKSRASRGRSVTFTARSEGFSQDSCTPARLSTVRCIGPVRPRMTALHKLLRPGLQGCIRHTDLELYEPERISLQLCQTSTRDRTREAILHVGRRQHRTCLEFHARDLGLGIRGSSQQLSFL